MISPLERSEKDCVLPRRNSGEAQFGKLVLLSEAKRSETDSALQSRNSAETQFGLQSRNSATRAAYLRMLS
jgi:hypothetical protein